MSFTNKIDEWMKEAEERPESAVTIVRLIARRLRELTERKSRFTLLGKVSRRTARAVRRQVCKLLLPVKDKVHTLTSDHGKEFADHELIAETLQLKFYFAHPYTAWEPSTNENTKGLLRQYFPKKCDFQSVSDKMMRQAVSKLNFRPPKTLRFKTPFEVFYNTTVALTS